MNESFPEPGSAIRFAIDYDCPSIIPAAAYTLTRISFNSDWEHRNEGVDGMHSHNDGRYPYTQQAARWHLLTAEEILQFCRGREMIIEFWDDLCSEFSDFITDQKVSRYCVRRDNPSSRTCFGDLQKPNSFTELPNFLSTLKCMAETCGDWECFTCGRVVQNFFTDRRVELWNSLPEMFNFKVVE
ncbi:hypothetical protein ABKN59_005235 [Abortiporus biennis]